MKTIGLVGGMSWESTQTYYQAINQGIKEQLGGLHSAELVLYSVDFDAIEKLQHQGDWPATAEILSQAAMRVEAGGAEALLICTNTMHKVADNVANAIDIPLIHIADATAEVLIKQNIQAVGLLGTDFTMSQDFYKGRLQEKYGLNVLIPDGSERKIVHDVIYQELCLGEIREASRENYLEIINNLHARGAQAVILGCTEIGLLVKQTDTTVPLIDTTAIHADAAVRFMLSDT